MSQDKSIKLIKAVKELNIGMGTIVDFLATKGYKVDKQPMAKLDGDMYNALLKEFAFDKSIKEEAKQISIGKIRKEEPVSHPQITNKIDLELQKEPAPADLAIALIEKCLTKGDLVLDLGNCGLTSKDFTANNSLDKALHKCVHLERLSLSNRYTFYDDIISSKRPEESKNEGRRNFLTLIPTALRALKKLKVFICCGDIDSKWQISNTEPLSNLVSLEYLDLSYNWIQSLKLVNKLITLKICILHNNKITSIKNTLNLPKLKVLDFHTNLIEKVEAIGRVVLITFLDLSDNRIKEISGLKDYANLEQLFLQRNNLTQIEDLEQLALRNDGFYLQVDDNPVVSEMQLNLLPIENHFPFVKEVLSRRLDESEKVDIQYPVKILIFGNHSTGKSSLVNFLTNEDQKGSTHILRIVNYNIATTNNVLPDAIFFDFGGQDFYHGVYRAFISENALQLILFNQETDYNETSEDVNKIPNINFNRTYWLGQKNYQETDKSNNAPYVLIQTYEDLAVKEPEAIRYSDYPGLQKTFNLSLTQNVKPELSKYKQEFYSEGRLYFQKYLNSIIYDLQVSNLEPVWYIKFLKFIIDKQGKDYRAFHIDDILLHYGANHLSDENRKHSLVINLTQLHRFGLVLYYPEIAGMNDICWLNPQKLVEHIQNDLLAKAFTEKSINKKPGVIAKVNFTKIVTDEKIILLLEAQKVVFFHDPTGEPKDQEYILPNYLQLSQKDDIDLQFSTFGFDHPNFAIKFSDFVPFGFINQMICFYGKLPDLKRFWRDKLLFTINKEVRVLIDLDFESLMIKVNFQILSKSSYDLDLVTEFLFFSIMGLYWNLNADSIANFNEFLELKNGIGAQDDNLSHKRSVWGSLKRESKYVPVDAFISLNNIDFVNYYDLYSLPEDVFTINAYKIKNKKIAPDESQAIQIGQFKSFTSKKLAIVKKIFFSYSRYDRLYRDEFQTHFATLKRQGVITTWYDGEIEAGGDANAEILKQLNIADIILCLLSPQFMANDYIWGIEMQKAKNAKKVIIPISIRACEYKNYFAEYFKEDKQGFLTQKQFDVQNTSGTTLKRDIIWIASEQHEAKRDEYYNFIVEELRKIIER